MVLTIPTILTILAILTTLIVLTTLINLTTCSVSSTLSILALLIEDGLIFRKDGPDGHESSDAPIAPLTSWSLLPIFSDLKIGVVIIGELQVEGSESHEYA